MKRDTCIGSGNVIEDAKARLTSINDTLCINVTQFSCVDDFSEFNDITNNDTDVYLKALLNQDDCKVQLYTDGEKGSVQVLR